MMVKDPKKANWLIRFVYALLLLGYIMSWMSAYKAINPLKEYNEMMIKYVSAITVNGRTITFRSFKNADEILNKELKERVSIIKDNVKLTFEDADSADLQEELNSGTELVDTELFKNVNEDFDIKTDDISKEEVDAVMKSKESYPIVERLLKSNKLIKSILLFLTFPAFSPLILAIVVKVLVTRIYVKSTGKIPNEIYMEKIPSMYTTNLIIAIFAIMAFYTEPVIGLAFAAYSHLLFTYQLFKGLILAPSEVRKSK